MKDRRYKKVEDKTVQISITIPAWIVWKLDELSDNNRSGYITEAIKEKMIQEKDD